MPPSDRTFPTETKGLREASPTEVIRLADGDTLELEVTAVRKRIGEHEVRMLAYNGSIPGPVLVVQEGSEIEVRAVNRSDVPTTIHWHGLRLDNASDGVPGETQEPIGIGASYACRVRFPDAGYYWYHPHIREDYAQELGLYGGIVVEPRAASYWPQVDRELPLMLDDLLVEDGRIAPFARSGPSFTAMGRFGNTMLVNGETFLSEQAAVGEVVRLHLVNTANTRIFNVALPGARMKLVGGDSGRCEREEFVEEVLLSPSERASLDVLFDAAADVALEHRTPDGVYELGRFSVTDRTDAGAASATFEQLRTDPELGALRQSLGGHLEREPDEVLVIDSEIRMEEEADSPDGGHHHHHHHSDPGDGLEWEDLMPEMNRSSDNSNMVWRLVDERTGAANGDISWSLAVGDQVKIRLVNGMHQDHPMHHPFHVHGAGRFLILSRDGRPEPNLVWKDTVLIRAGETVDLLLDVTNPGRWMAHCHIAEHTESNMMFSFDVS